MKTRAMNSILQNWNYESENFNNIANQFGEILNAKVWIIDTAGNLLGCDTKQECQSNRKKIVEHFTISEPFRIKLTNLFQSTTNLEMNSSTPQFSTEITDLFGKHFILFVPVFGNGNRLGTLIISRPSKNFDQEDLLLAEHGAMVLSLKLLWKKTQENEIETRKKAVVELVLSSLSYSERTAIEYIIKELNGNEGKVVASKIAKSAGITRSLCVNALRKLKCAGVIDTYSLGTKGTYIKILNEYFLSQMEEPTA